MEFIKHVRNEEKWFSIYLIEAQIAAVFGIITITKSEVLGYNIATISNLHTEAIYRNRGYATAWLKEAEQIAAIPECRTINLWVEANSERLLHFYTTKGYSQIYAENDMLLLQKVLSDL